MEKIGKRIYRSATPEEAVRHAVVRQQIEAELSAIKQLGREKLVEAMQCGVDINDQFTQG